MKQYNSLLLLLLSVHLLKGVVTSIVVPLWEFPDEQAHFAQVSYYSEIGLSFDQDKDLSEEIYRSEEVMGTLRNSRGENFYTYQPQNKIKFSSSTIGPKENYLADLPLSSRTHLIKKEAARYPPLFYLLSSLGYGLAYHSSLFTRVFLVRLISVLLGAFAVYLTYLTGQEIFPKKSLYPITLAALLSFHPMFSFVSSGINNDNLINLVGIALTLLSLRLVNHGLSISLSAATGIAIGFGVLAKPLIFPLLPAVFFVILYDWYKSKRPLANQLKLLSPLIFIALVGGGWFFLWPIIKTGDIPYLPKVSAASPLHNLSLIDYLKPQLSKYYRETFVWYWGVFKWLGVILPLNLVRAIKVIIGLAAIGIFKLLASKSKLALKTPALLFILIALSYAATLTLWDYQLVRSIGFSHGLQGRNFFPTVTAHLGLILIGLLALAPAKLRPRTAKLLTLFFVVSQTISFWTLVNSYYHLESINSLLLQLSQYKPLLLKYPISLLWLGLYLASLLSFLSKLFRLKASKSNHK